MLLILGALGLLVLSGLGALLINKSSRKATQLGVIGVVLSCILGSIPAFRFFLSGQEVSFSSPLNIPYANFLVGMDGLSAFFLLPIFILSALAAIYGAEYLKPWHGKKPIGVSWFFFNLLVASMVLVVISRNAILFLLAWEMMSIASYFLVTFEEEKLSVQKAGMLYLIATQLGTAFLLVLFILLGKGSASLDFNHFQVLPGVLPSVIFILAVIGFGTKAGFIPFHVWLPEAHPAAPSHVSALMSGVMIKTGIYGLVRILMFLGMPPLWWGWLLIAIGITSGILGVLLALAQHDLKRLLAYHSVENIGIIALGIGVGLMGMSINSPILIVLGWTGGLLHVLNHAFFKGLLFFGAGAVLHETGTREIDCLGGLLKNMPATGICFLIGAAAICGLPPLNGFVSEFLIYLGAFHGTGAGASIFLSLLGVIAALAMIGALAVACFTKAFGIIFLGEPRAKHCQNVHEVKILMKIPMYFLAGSCVLVGLLGPLIIKIFIRILPGVTGLPEGIIFESLQQAIQPLTYVTGAGFGFLALLGMIVLLRRKLLKNRKVEESLTWDCGYAAPSARMQYTASSFAQPLTDFLGGLIRIRRQIIRPQGIFPKDASLVTQTPDIFEHGFYRPIFEKFYNSVLKLRFFQHGRLQFYILYIVVTLLVLLIWKLR